LNMNYSGENHLDGKNPGRKNIANDKREIPPLRALRSEVFNELPTPALRQADRELQYIIRHKSDCHFQQTVPCLLTHHDRTHIFHPALYSPNAKITGKTGCFHLRTARLFRIYQRCKKRILYKEMKMVKNGNRRKTRDNQQIQKWKQEKNQR